MKLFSLLFFTIFLGKGCDTTKGQDIKTATIEYTAITRGFYQKIIVKNQMVTVFKNANENQKGVAIKISDATWQDLVVYFKEINLEGLAALKSPTEKRFYDGAALANLKITYKDKDYETTAFDHGFPPKEIKKLVDLINTFAKKEEYPN